MTTQTITKTTELISTSALSYIRPMTLNIDAFNLKPFTRMYPFFDGVDVSRFVTPTGGLIGDQLITDANGSISGSFKIPGKTFSVGEKLFVLQQNSSYQISSTETFAKAKFTSAGVLRRFQTTQTTTNTNVVEQVNRVNVPIPVYISPKDDGPRQDPLAQSFSTYGVKDGCFVTSIDLFFSSKDSSTSGLPVWVELREMQNGSPTEKLVYPYAKSVKLSQNVSSSTDASISTKFTFPKPVYLKQDSDYCFVIQSKSDKYEVWSSRLGEPSKETGKIVFDQPHNGSMFKSSNNFTWSPEQNEDIKFRINKAAFVSPTTGSVKLALSANPISVYSEYFSTTIGSNVIDCRLPFKHALQSGDKIGISCSNNSTYNGIPGSAINLSSIAVNTIIDEFTFNFVCSSSATSSGPITSGGRIVDVIVDNPGTTTYTDNTVDITYTSSSGTGFTGVALIVGGKINDTKVTNTGYGYKSDVVLSVVGSSGLKLTPILTEKFLLVINREYHTFTPEIPTFIPPNTKISSLFSGLNQTNSTVNNIPVSLYNKNNLSNDMKILSRVNEDSSSLTNSTRLDINFSSIDTHNPNVSPVFDLYSSRAWFGSNSINASSTVVVGLNQIDTETYPDVSFNTKLGQTRYITKQQVIEETSTSVKVFVTAYSNVNSNFDVYIRKSNSSSSVDHRSIEWTPLNCDVSRNMSTKPDEYIEYQFYLEDLEPFDTFSYKFVLKTTTKYDPPIIDNYRSIILV